MHAASLCPASTWCPYFVVDLHLSIEVSHSDGKLQGVDISYLLCMVSALPMYPALLSMIPHNPHLQHPLTIAVQGDM